MKLDNTRSDKSLPRPLYEKIKEFIESSLKSDFDMLIDGYDYFDQLKPTLRFRLVEDVFYEFIMFFKILFSDSEKLQKNPRFDGLSLNSKEFVSYFICNLYCRIYVPNQIIVRKGERFAEMYMIQSGTVMLSLKTKWQNEYF